MKNSRIATLLRSLQHEGGRRHKLCDTAAEDAVSVFSGGFLTLGDRFASPGGRRTLDSFAGALAN